MRREIPLAWVVWTAAVCVAGAAVFVHVWPEPRSPSWIWGSLSGWLLIDTIGEAVAAIGGFVVGALRPWTWVAVDLGAR